MTIGRRAWRLALPLLGTGVSAASVVMLIRLVRPSEIRTALGDANPWLIGLAALLLLATYAPRSFRWSLLLRRIAPLPHLDVLSAQAIGMMGNMVLPARAGDIGRGILVARKAHISAVTALTTVGVERLLDLAANLFILAVLAFAGAVPIASTLYVGRVRALTSTGPIVLFVAALLAVAIWARAGAPGLGPLEPVRRRIVTGFNVFSDRRALAKAALWSLVIWGTLGIVNYTAMLAVGIRLPFHAAFAVLIAQTVGVAIPSSPGYIGTFHVATVLALSLYGVAPAASVPLAIITHAVGLVVTVLVGVPFLYREGLTARELWRGTNPSAASVV